MSTLTGRLVSCNVGKPIVVSSGGRDILTGIFKHPVQGPVHAGRFNLDGDQQADLTVHGGFYKAVYLYPSEHYAFWREQLPDSELPWGMFGENLTTEGLHESTINIGDQLRIGSASFQVTQPRMPCFKLAAKFNRPDMVKRFWASGRSGFYLSVVDEGEIEAGQTLERTATGKPAISVAEVVKLYRDPHPNRSALERALEAPLATSWKKELRERLLRSLAEE